MPLSNFAKQTINSMKKAVLKDSDLRQLVFRLLNNYKNGSKIRRNLMNKGILVPPILIFSVTNKCNFACQGCYHKAKIKEKKAELTSAEFKRILSEINDTGIRVVLLAGGEPFMRSDLLEVTALCPEITFFIFTNGSMVDSNIVKELSRQKNVILILSTEGPEEVTDSRRGKGVYQKLNQNIALLNQKNLVFGVSITVSKNNVFEVLQENYVKALIEEKCRVFFLSEYISLSDDQNLVLNAEERATLSDKIKSFRRKYPAVFFTTSDEDEFGGCLAAGRGFLHINAGGGLEPCPMAPFSNINLKKTPFIEALKSPFLAKIRKNPDLLAESKSGCSLWDKKEWVKKLLSEN